MKSGTISIVGRSNVGKSTLLNRILGKKIAITSDKAGTTRNLILGVYNDDESQIVFVDTPGVHKPMDKLGNLLNKKAYMMMENVDAILFIVDISHGFGKGDTFILDKIKEMDIPILLVLNKIDNIKKEKLIEEVNKLKDIYPFKEIIPLSARDNININELVKTLKNYLPYDQKFYDDDYLTNQPKSMIITERVREKVLELTAEEVPHTVTCILETYEEKKDILKLGVIIILDRDNLKKIIIGKHGSMLKEIGTRARIDLEEYFNKKVYLSLYVKTVNNWRNRDSLIHELGLRDDIDEE